MKMIVTKKEGAQIASKVAEYDELRLQKKVIDERMKVLAKEIKDYSVVYGVKDDKGSYYVENDDFIFGQQCKKSVKLDNDKVIEYFKSNGLKDYILMKEYVPEEEVERLSSNGTIPYEDLEGLCKITSTSSIMVKMKEKVTAEVEEHEVLPIAASKKPKLKVAKNRK